MHLRPLAPFAVLLLTLLGGCSSDGTDGDPEALDDGPEIASENPSDIGEPVSPAVSDSELLGFWELTDYTLDDGTSKTVPETVFVWINFRSSDTLRVTYSACDSVDATYRLDNGVLTTTDSMPPPGNVGCAGQYDDVDDPERSGLMRRALLDTQTMVAMSDDDVLTVTTGNNEVLVFDRVAETTPASEMGADLPIVDVEWELIDYRTSEGEDVPATFSPPYSVRFSDNEARHPFQASFPTCGRLEGDYLLDGSELTMVDVGDVSAVISCDSTPSGDDRTDTFLADLFVGTQSLSADITGDVLTLMSASGARARFANGGLSGRDAELVGRWRLSGYTLDDGIQKPVPESDSLAEGLEIDIQSDGTLYVNACTGYTASYTIDNGILTTTDAVFGENGGCDPYPEGSDARERFDLFSTALLNTQAMIVVSDDVLTVTTGNNEVLVFDRVDELPVPEIVGQWLLRGYSVNEDGLSVELDIDNPDSRVVLDLGPDGMAELAYNCGGLEGTYRFDDVVLSFEMSESPDDRDCAPPATDEGNGSPATRNVRQWSSGVQRGGWGTRSFHTG